MKRQLKRLLWPAAGLDRSLAYQEQPPFTTPDAVNVRLRGAVEGRQRGGSRPGLERVFYTQVGEEGGSPVRLLAQVPVSWKYPSWLDDFDGAALNPANGWTLPAWGTFSLPGQFRGSLLRVPYDDEVGAVLGPLPLLYSGGAYSTFTVSLFIVPYRSQHAGTYRLYARMTDDDPDVTDYGLEAELDLDSDTGGYSGTLTSCSGGTPTSWAFTGGSVDYAAPGWFTMVVEDGTVTCYWYGNLLISQAVASTDQPPARTRTGFSVKATRAGSMCLVDKFQVQYKQTSSVTPEAQLFTVVSAGGHLYYAREDYNQTTGATVPGFLTQKSTALVLSDDHFIQAAARGNKLFIADYGTDKPPLVFNHPTLEALSVWTASGGKGTIPSQCPHICLYHDRMVLAGYPANVWHMSRLGDPFDWKYDDDPEDPGRAIAGTASEAGVLADDITALIPHRDETLVFGCEHSLWVLQGDPLFGGRIDNVSHNIGIVGPLAWCRTPSGELVFLSADGLYLLPASGLGVPVPLSRPRLPAELVNFDPRHHLVQLAYDMEAQGIHIYRTPVGG